MTTTLSAYAITTLGDPELVILDAPHNPIASHPLVGIDAEGLDEYDAVIGELGYRRVGVWEDADHGYVTRVESQQ